MSELSAARLSSVQRIKDKAKSAKEPEPPSLQQSDLTSIRRSLMIVAIAACGAILWAAQAILVPTAIAIVLALVLTPVVVVLERWRIPTSIAALLVVVFAAASIAGAAATLAPAVADWIKRAPEISHTIQRKLLPIKTWLVSYEVASAELHEIAKVGAPSDTAVTVAAPPAASSAWAAPAALAQTSYIIVLALFMIVVRKVYRKRLILLASDRADRLRVTRILNQSLAQASQYLFAMLCVSVGLAFVTAACFALAGIENAVLWGAVFGAASFIPYVGPAATMLACGLVQFATQDTLAAAAVAPLILLAINVIESNIVTPLLVSRRTAISAIAIFLTVAAFIWLWGPVASIVAIPALILFSAVAKNVPRLQPYAILLQAENGNAEEIINAARLHFFSDVDGRESATWRRYVAGLFRPARTSGELTP